MSTGFSSGAYGGNPTALPEIGMTLQPQRDIARTLRVLNHAEACGNVALTCRHFTLSYSDSGRNLVGECRGNGWVDHTVVLNGRRR
jgi:hypothetical protein